MANDPKPPVLPPLPPAIDNDAGRAAVEAYRQTFIEGGGQAAFEASAKALRAALPELGDDRIGELNFEVFSYVDRYHGAYLNRARRDKQRRAPVDPLPTQLQRHHEARMADMVAGLIRDGTADKAALVYLKARRTGGRPDQEIVNLIRAKHPSLTLDEPHQVMVALLRWLEANRGEWWARAKRAGQRSHVVDVKDGALGVICTHCLRRVVLEPGEPIDVAALRCTKCKRKSAEAWVLATERDLKRFRANGRN